MDSKAISAKEAKQQVLNSQTGTGIKAILDCIYDKIREAVSNGRWIITYYDTRLINRDLRDPVIDRLEALGYEVTPRVFSTPWEPNFAHTIQLTISWED